MAEEVCCGDVESEDEGGVRLEGMDVDMDSAEKAQVQGESLEKWLRGVVARKVEFEQRWRSAT
jgi:exosome complex component RRP46